MHCSNLAADALHEAIKNWREGVGPDDAKKTPGGTAIGVPSRCTGMGTIGTMAASAVCSTSAATCAVTSGATCTSAVALASTGAGAATSTVEATTSGAA